MRDYYIVNVCHWTGAQENVFQHKSFEVCRRYVIEEYLYEALDGDVTITHVVEQDISVCWEDYK